MIGYYRLTDEEIKELPSGSRNIENDIYNLVYPLIIGDELPKDLYLLYTTLEIPIIKFKDINTYNNDDNKEQKKYIKEFSEYLKLNTEIENLEEGEIGHTLRVGRYALEICKLRNLNKEKTKDIYIAALFHDVGKTRIPNKILSKPKKLNKKEFEIIKEHSKYGVEIMSDFLNENILEMIMSHHERCDKSGYPKGIIPNEGSKIIGIADSYDAMVSNRVYRKNKSLKAAQEELIRCSLEIVNGGKGKLYDEEIVRQFVLFHGYNTLIKKHTR